MIEVLVTYKVKQGRREEFLKKISDEGIDEASRREEGNIRYDYFFPQNKDELFLLEMWQDGEALKAHAETAHFLRLQEFKKDYLDGAVITKYKAEKL